MYKQVFLMLGSRLYMIVYYYELSQKLVYKTVTITRFMPFRFTDLRPRG